MAVLSIRPFPVEPELDTTGRSKEAAACRKAVSTLLDGVATYALELDRDARRSFRERIGEIRRAVTADTSAEAVPESAEAAVRAIGDYARHTTRLMHSQNAEMQNMATLMGQTITDVSSAGARAVTRLRKFSEELERVAALMGPSLKARLRELIGEIQTEARQREVESERISQKLRREMFHKQQAWRNLGLEPASEAPGELVAQAQLLSAINGNGQRHLAVFVLNSAASINLRLGRDAGDEVIRALKQYLGAHLSRHDRMFRWSAQAIVISLGSGETFEEIRARLSRFLDRPIERTFEVNRRPVSVFLEISWSVFAVSEPLAELNRQINEFIASRADADRDANSDAAD